MRDLPFLNQIFALSNEVRAEQEIQRVNFANDNAFAEAFAADVKQNWKIPTVNSVSDSSTATADIVANELSPNEGKALVKSTGKTWLIFYNNYAPGWRAFVNSNPAPILRINHLFMGVQLPAGTNLVEFKFQPKWVLRLIALPYLLIVLSALALALRYLFRKKPGSS